MKLKEPLLKALHAELELQKNYLKEDALDTIYFGGGTPSLLSESELNEIFEIIYKNYTVTENPEITLEANPDDLNKDKIKILQKSPINRLSIGIQSFRDEDLKLMNRAHTGREARESLEECLKADFNNITIDLIYGIPGMNDKAWEEQIQTAINYNIPHISSYCLTVEPKTALEILIKTGKIPNVEEEQSASQYELLINILTQNNYDHYEISNFGKPGFHSRHNSAYWQGVPYLGIGPSAHSFNGKSRQWNVANNPKYIKALESNQIPATTEHLSQKDLYNEYLLTGLRTSQGCSLEKINAYGRTPEFLKQVVSHVAAGFISKNRDTYFLTQKGKLLGDSIISSLFWE